MSITATEGRNIRQVKGFCHLSDMHEAAGITLCLLVKTDPQNTLQPLPSLYDKPHASPNTK